MTFLPLYKESHALVIGINDYLHASPLTYAENDATSIAELLVQRFSFEKGKVTLLIGAQASRNAIIREYLRFQKTDKNDRILVYFAGHGFTTPSRLGSVGYLVPQDGSPSDLSSLVRWEELTINTDLIPAKHVFFAMDACYSGLAFNRSLGPGATRLVGDMLTRVARQAIAAGQHDQEVADFGGPLPEHSIFTGYMLEGLNGDAADPNEGVITANGLMAYVRQRVGLDPKSRQTPHYGTIEGSGDFVFNAPLSVIGDESSTKGVDVLVEIPGVPIQGSENTENLIKTAKGLLGNPAERIKLQDLLVSTTRNALALTTSENFPVAGDWNDKEFLKRLEGYELALSDLVTLQTLLGYWLDGDNSEAKTLLNMPIRRFAERIQPESGYQIWSAMRWYPSVLLTYAGGLAAVSAKNYFNLNKMLSFFVTDSYHSARTAYLLSLYDFFTQTSEIFKLIPAHKNHFVPRSEYLYNYLQPTIDDLLFQGKEYEHIFDEFEVIFSLEFANFFEKHYQRIWSPVGRFGWKHKSLGSTDSPLVNIVSQANKAKDSWEPIVAGMFDGSYKRFKEVADQYIEFADKLPFY